MATEHTVPVDGEELAAVHHEADSDRWLVFCHGFLSDKTGSYESRCERALEEGYNGVRFDFRGSGDSDGAFVDQHLSSRIRDLRAVLEYFDPPKCVVFGSSFGGKVAFHTDDDRIEALATRAPVTYNRAFAAYRELIDEEGELRLDDEHAINERFFEDFDRYEFADVAADLGVPVAVFHGTDDDSVPLSDSIEAVGALDGDVLLQTYAGEGHRFSERAERRLRDQLFDWLAVLG